VKFLVTGGAGFIGAVGGRVARCYAGYRFPPTEYGKPADAYWFMWYDKDGEPMIPESAMLRKKDLQETIRRLADCVQVPDV
jgi:hypothetical protein